MASDSDGAGHSSQLSRQVPSNDGVYSNETGATATVGYNLSWKQTFAKLHSNREGPLVESPY